MQKRHSRHFAPQNKEDFMKYLVDSREMQKYDANTISHFKVPGLLLMERAAIAFVEELHRQNVDLT